MELNADETLVSYVEKVLRDFGSNYVINFAQLFMCGRIQKKELNERVHCCLCGYIEEDVAARASHAQLDSL